MRVEACSFRLQLVVFLSPAGDRDRAARAVPTLPVECVARLRNRSCRACRCPAGSRSVVLVSPAPALAGRRMQPSPRSPESCSSATSDSAASRLSSATRIFAGARGLTTSTGPCPPSCRALRALITVAGNRTMNSLPRPRPSLRASTVPPWRLTRPFTRPSPMPRPPCVRSIAVLTCENIANNPGIVSAAQADARVLHGDRNPGGSARRCERDLPARIRVLRSIRQQIRRSPATGAADLLRA